MSRIRHGLVVGEMRRSSLARPRAVYGRLAAPLLPHTTHRRTRCRWHSCVSGRCGFRGTGTGEVGMGGGRGDAASKHEPGGKGGRVMWEGREGTDGAAGSGRGTRSQGRVRPRVRLHIPISLCPPPRPTAGVRLPPPACYIALASLRARAQRTCLTLSPPCFWTEFVDQMFVDTCRALGCERAGMARARVNRQVCAVFPSLQRRADGDGAGC